MRWSYVFEGREDRGLRTFNVEGFGIGLVLYEVFGDFW